MLFFSVFLPLGVFVVISDCLPVSNSTIKQKGLKVSTPRLPLNSSVTSYRSSPGGLAKNRNPPSSTIAAEEPFFFPVDDPPKVLNRFKPIPSKKIPKCAKDSTFCEEIEDYPMTYLENVFQNAVDDFHELLGVDQLNSSDLVHKIDAPNESSLCASEEQIVFPKTAKTKDDKWLYVVNQASYVQGVRIEKCLKSNDAPTQSCFFTESFPIGYKATCKQKYIYRKLVALDEEGKPVTDTFQLPSCCSCTVVSDGLSSRQAALRKALGTTTARSTGKL